MNVSPGGCPAAALASSLGHARNVTRAARRPRRPEVEANGALATAPLSATASNCRLARRPQAFGRRARWGVFDQDWEIPKEGEALEPPF